MNWNIFGLVVAVLGLVVLAFLKPDILKAFFGSKAWKKLGTEVTALALGIIVVYYTFWMLEMLFKVGIPADNKEVILLIVGVVIGKFGTIVDFFFGSSKGSSEKNELLAPSKQE